MQDKTLWIIANWKSNKTISEALEWIDVVGSKLQSNDQIKVVVCPTFTAIEEVKKAVKVGAFPIMVGSQDLSPYEEGSYTGEEAAVMLQQFVELSIIGHSERREHFKETDELVALKVEQATMHNIMPLVCVQNEETPVPKECNLIAYEPVFAIGTGNPDTPENADLVSGKLKQRCGEMTQVLYGGSVTADNCQNFIRQKNIDGLLIGKASLDPEEFLKIVQNCQTNSL